MATRVVEGKKPYTGGKAISIDENKVISLNLRDENNLIIYDEGDDEIYVDLQLDDEITPTDAFPIGVNTGRVIVDNGWDKAGTIISAVTTSGDNIKILYADDGTLWMDNGTGTFKQVYFKADVDAIAEAIWNYINTNLNTKTFTLSSLSDLTTAQAIWDFYRDGGNPIIKYSGRQYFQTSYGNFGPSNSKIFASSVYHTHTSQSVNIGSSVFHPYLLQFNLDNDDIIVESVQENEIYDLSRLHVLTTDTDYQTPYTPQYDGSPATKKYVDDNVIQKGSTAPANPTEGMVWYDTTNDELKVYDGSNWISTGGGSDIEYVTQAEYNALLPGAESDGKHYFIYKSSESVTDNYIPDMTADTQDGFTATSSALLDNTQFHPRNAFHPSASAADKAWHSNNVGAGGWGWSGIQLPSGIKVTKIQIWARNHEAPSDLRPIAAFNLLGSNDGNTWTNILSETGLGNSRSIGSTQYRDITGQTTAYTYLKLEVQSVGDYVTFDHWNISGIVQ